MGIYAKYDPWVKSPTVRNPFPMSRKRADGYTAWFYYFI